MSSIGLENIVSIIVIAAYFFGVSFLWLLPLYIWLKKSVLAVQFVMPVSLSIQILFGYVFYSIEASQHYILPYLIIMALINHYYVKMIGFRRIITKITHLKQFLSWKNIAIFIFFLSIVSFSRFYDSFSTVAPGNNDTYNHIMFLKEVNEFGYIKQVTYYAPGFHLLVLPLTVLLPYSELYRFVGPVLGMLSVVGIFLLIRPALRNGLSKYVLLALLCFPVFNQLTLQTIGFFSTSLTFIFMTAFLMLLGFSNNKKLPHRYALTILLTLGLVVTVPYFFVQYSVALALLLFVAFIFRTICSRSFVIRLAAMMVISFLGVAGGYVHVLLQTSLHDSSYFPTVVKPVDTVQSHNPAPLREQDTLLESPFISKNVLPLISAGVDVAKIKAIRSPDSMLALGAYGWMVISILVAVFSVLQKRRSLLVLAILSLVYGIITQTGMVEMTTYKGRSGWYLLLLAILGTTFIYDKLIHLIKIELLILILVFMCASSVIFPPKHYRAYHVDQYDVLKSYLGQLNEKTIIYSSSVELGLINDNLEIQNLSGALDAGIVPEAIIVINKVLPSVDPVLSQQSLITDKNHINFYDSQELSMLHNAQIFNKFNKSDHCDDSMQIIETIYFVICKSL